MAHPSPIPQRATESASTPPAVETHLGTLEFPLGVPTEETAARLYDHLDYLHGVNAFLNVLPGVNTWAIRRGYLEAGIRDDDVVLWSEMMDAGTLLLGGSVDSVYFSSFVDLTDGPMVVEIPPLTLSFLNDLWARWVTDAGLGGPDRGAGGRYLLVPPGYEGPLPEGGFFVSRARTTRVFLWGRAFLDDDDPAPAVDRIRSSLRIHPYRPADHGTSIARIVTGGPAPPPPWTPRTWVAALEPPPPPRVVEASGLFLNTVMPSGPEYFELASELVHDQPAEALDPEIAGELAAVGIATDLAAFGDRDGQALDGGRHYTLTLPPGIPQGRFWSVTVCDTQTRSMLETPQGYPKAGSQGYPRPAATAGPDGATTIHFAPEPPEGVPEGNWIQTVPGKGWFVALRLYSPTEPFFDKTWRPGEIEPVG